MSENRYRNNRVQLRFSNEEKQFFETLFEKSKMKNRNDFVLYMLRHGKIINVQLQDEQLNNMSFALSQIGNNINQIARRLNSTDTIYKEDVNDILETKNQIEHIRSDLSALCAHFKIQE